MNHVNGLRICVIVQIPWQKVFSSFPRLPCWLFLPYCLNSDRNFFQYLFGSNLKDELKTGTLKAMLKQLGIKEDEI
ncbi:MAG: hypothetical protein ACRC1Z_18180 [Waterburya sp.]